jgi:hypothetical protein
MIARELAQKTRKPFIIGIGQNIIVQVPPINVMDLMILITLVLAMIAQKSAR